MYIYTHTHTHVYIFTYFYIYIYNLYFNRSGSPLTLNPSLDLDTHIGVCMGTYLYRCTYIPIFGSTRGAFLATIAYTQVTKTKRANP